MVNVYYDMSYITVIRNMKIFPGKKEERYTVWILSVTIAALLLSIMLSEFHSGIIFILTKHYWCLLPLLPFVFRVPLIFVFPLPSREQMSEAERDVDSHRGMYITLAGFSFSAFFALIIAATTSKVDVDIIGISAAYMLLSFLLFYSAFSIEAYKFYRWQVELVNSISEAGKISLLISVMIAMLSSSINIYIQHLTLISFIVFWSVNFFIHLSLRYKYLSAF